MHANSNKFKTNTIFEIVTVTTVEISTVITITHRYVVLGKKAKQTKKYSYVATRVKCLNF